LFESLPPDDAAARIRSAAVPPLAAFLITLAYLTVYPMLSRVPAPLFWTTVTILLLGTILGAIALIRVVRRERVRGRALGWLAAAIAIELLCARMFLGLTFPWI
jgi:ABC-type microcin C transport system permease subunit YejE